MNVDYQQLYNKMFFREFDVLHHIQPNDFWVILNRRVLDLSRLVQLIDELPSNNNELTVCICLILFIFIANVYPKELIIILTRYVVFFKLGATRRHCISSVFLVEQMSANCLRSAKQTNWKCLS